MGSLIIDADVIAYRAGFATEKTKYLTIDENGHYEYFDDAKAAKVDGNKMWSRKDVQPESDALMIADAMINDIVARYEGETSINNVFLYLTGVGNFRNGIATRATYKGNRAGSVPPVHLRAIRSHLVSRRGAVCSAGEEADDLIGIAMTANKDAVCCSIDKDLMQLPGRHYNFVTKEEVKVSPKEAVFNFYSQVISGDATDSIPGLTGYGPVKAKKALEGCTTPKDCWKRTVDLYIKEFGDDALLYATECARLVYVRRKPGELWQPPK